MLDGQMPDADIKFANVLNPKYFILVKELQITHTLSFLGKNIKRNK